MKKSKKYNKIKLLEKLLVIIPIVIALCIISRMLPDNTLRLNLGESEIGDKAIALTFDDGPSENTEKLLDGLDEYGAKVTFFVLGSKAEENPDIVLRAYEEGHLIANHTYSHMNFLLSNKEGILEDINKGEQVIEKITGTKPLFLRPPHGYINSYQLKQIDKFFVKWSVDSKDWDGKDANYIFNRIINAEDGDIILLHDTNEATVRAVLSAIPVMQEEGYRFVSVDELLTRNGDKLKMNVAYRKCEADKNPVVF